MNRYLIVSALLVLAGVLSGCPDFDKNAPIKNIKPVAQIEAPQQAGFGEEVVLDGSGSYDGNNDPLTYRWRQISGPAVELSSATEPQVSFVAPNASGTVIIELVVNDSFEDSEPAYAQIELFSRPIADAGADATVNVGALVQLQGSGYDPDGNPLTYRWRQVGGREQVELSATDIPNPTFVAPDTADTLVFELVVSNGTNESAPDQVTITVKELPVAVVAQDYIAVRGGVLVTLDGSGSYDPQQRQLTYRWTQTYGIEVNLSDPTSAITTFIAPTVKAELRFELVVSNGEDESMPAKVIVRTDNPPTAEAGDDLTVTPGSLVVLNGTGSDPDGDSVSFRWRQIDGPEVELSSTEIANPQFTAPSTAAKLTFELTVTDGVLESEPDTVNVLVNNLPVADAGDDQLVEGGVQVTLDGSGSSDADGQQLSYKWEQTGGPSVVLFGADTVSPTFIAPQTKCALAFRLTVNDGLNDGIPDEVIVFVNNKPVADAGDDKVVLPGEQVLITGTGIDRDNEVLTYHWEQQSGPEVELQGADTPTVSFDAPQTVGVIVLALTVSDGQQTSDPDTVSIVVNHPPVADAGPDQTVTAGSRVELDGSASHDLEETDLAFSWRQVIGPEVLLLNPDTAHPSFVAPSDNAMLVFELVVSDSYSQSAPDTVQITVKYNRPPVADAGENVSIPNNSTAVLTGNVSDPDGDPILEYEWEVTSYPPNAVFTLTGESAIIAYLEVHTKGNYVLSFRAKDEMGWGAPDTVVVHAENNPPVADAGTESISVVNRSSVQVSGSGSDEDGDEITSYQWNVVATPPDAVYTLENADAATATFTPLTKGVYQLAFTVFDGEDWSSPDYLTVTATNNPPQVEAGEDVSIPNLQSATLQAIATDPDEDSLSYRWEVVSTEPDGLSWTFTNPTEASTQFVPNGKGSYTLQITVTDTEGASASDTITVVATNNPPVADAGDDIDGASTGEIFLSAARSYDPDGDSLLYTWELVDKPAQAVESEIRNSHSQSATLYAQPFVYGTYVVQLTVSDTEGASSSSTIAITVQYDAPVAEAKASPESGLPGTEITLDGTASVDPDGGEIQSYIWEQIGGSPVDLQDSTSAIAHFTIPDGVHYDPSEDNAFVFRLTVTDDEGTRGSTIVKVYLLPQEDDFIYVSPSGNDSQGMCGTRSHPCRHLQIAVYLAEEQQKPVLVAGGEYITMADRLYLPPGVKLYGGFDRNTWDRDLEQNPTIIRGNDNPQELTGNCIDEDGNNMLNNPNTPPTDEVCDNIDNDFDGSVDEDIPACDHSGEDLLEDNDDWTNARPILLHTKYGQLYVTESDPDRYMIDTTDRPPDCGYKLGVYAHGRYLILKVYNADMQLVAQGSVAEYWSGSVDLRIDPEYLTDTMYIAVDLHPAGTEDHYELFVRYVPIKERFYVGDNAVVYLKGAAEPWDESKMNVLDGFTIYDHEENISFVDSRYSLYSYVVYCDECSMRMQNCNVYAHSFGRYNAYSSFISSAVGINNTYYKVEILDNYFETGYGRGATGIILLGDRVRDLTIARNTFETSTERTLLDPNNGEIDMIYDITSAGTAQFSNFVIDSNYFHVMGTGDQMYCIGFLTKHDYEQTSVPEVPMYITNNLFWIDASCTSNLAIYFNGGSGYYPFPKLFASNNTFYYVGVGTNSYGFYMNEKPMAMTWLNNYFEGWRNCLVMQRTPDVVYDLLFANNILQCSDCVFSHGSCLGIDDLNSYTADCHDNIAATCEFVDAETGDFHLADGSLCIDYGELPAEVPDQYPQVPEWLVHDLEGNPRTVDDPAVFPPEGVRSDNTDVGAYERQ